MNLKDNNILKAVSLSVVGVAVTGCATSTETVRDANNRTDAVNQVSSLITNEQNSFSERRTFVKENDGIFVGGKAFRVSDRDMLPAMFNRQVSYNQPEAKHFFDLVSELSEYSGVRITVTDDALAFLEGKEELNGSGDSSNFDDMVVETHDVGFDLMTGNPLPSPVNASRSGSMNNPAANRGHLTFPFVYTGTMEGMFDVLSSKANLFWKFENNRVTIYRQSTKTFVLDTLSGNTSFAASVGTSSASSGENSGSLSATSSTITTYESNPDSPWEAVKESIESMLSESGRVAYAEQTGTITVNDTPNVVNSIERYLDNINEVLSQRIVIRTEIYDVTYDENTDFGVDFQTMFAEPGKFIASLGSGFNSVGDSTGALARVSLLSGKNNHIESNAVVTALKNNFKTSLVSSSTSHTTNGIAVPVQVMDTISYLSEVSSSTDDEGATSTTLTPGQISTGFNMAVLPKTLSNGDIMMQLSLDISILNEMRRFTSGEQTIELPNTSNKTFMQRIAMKPGETIMVSGFERIESNARTQSVFGDRLWGLGGNNQGGTQRTRTIVLITPLTLSR